MTRRAGLEILQSFQIIHKMKMLRLRTEWMTHKLLFSKDQSPVWYNSDYNLMFCGSNIIFLQPEAANCCYIFIKHNLPQNSRKMSQNKKRDHPDSLNRTKYYLNFQLNRQVNLAAAHIISTFDTIVRFVHNSDL